MKKILIVDKSMSYALYLGKILMEDGFDVRILSSTRDLEPLNKTFSYEAIFMDINEYIVGGLPFIKGVKILQPDTRIIFTSENGSHDKKVLKNAMEYGVYGCIHKPFDREEVLAMTDGLNNGKKLGCAFLCKVFIAFAFLALLMLGVIFHANGQRMW